MLFSPNAQLDIAQRLWNSSAPLEKVSSFISGLYFLGKLSYAERFKDPPPVLGLNLLNVLPHLVPDDYGAAHFEWAVIAKQPKDAMGLQACRVFDFQKFVQVQPE
jgi:hypothetical protein